MPRELRVSAVISVPDDLFPQAQAIANLHPAIMEFEAALKVAAGPADEVTVTSELVTPRPRGSGETPVKPEPAPPLRGHAHRGPAEAP